VAEPDVNDVSGLVSSIGDTLIGALGPADPSTVFSEPTKIGDDLVITAAAWERGVGFGFGFGDGRSASGEAGTGGGGGGGGGSQGRPVAVIRVSPTGIEVTPLIDFTKIGITLLLGFVGVLGALASGRRHRT
jgi:uncharacterized spore protein YtfJ